MRMLRPILAVILVMVSTTALADIVVFKDGSRIEGEVVEDGERIRIKLDCGDMAVPKNQIDRVIKCDTPRQKFKKKLASIDKGDIEALKKLKEWCTQNRLEKEAAQIALSISRLVLEKKSAGLDMKKAEDVFDALCEEELELFNEFLRRIEEHRKGKGKPESRSFWVFARHWDGSDRIKALMEEIFGHEVGGQY